VRTRKQVHAPFISVLYPSADRCLSLQLAAAFLAQSGTGRSLRNPMNTMVLTRPGGEAAYFTLAFPGEQS
jgi:hypothetical protein